MLPAARAPLMVGVNQVIMLSLNMVIIASMIGAGGLGYDVLAALRRLDIGAGVEAGVAIVVLAVVLDRLSQAYAVRAPRRAAARAASLLAAPAAALALWALAFAVPAIAHYPERLEVSTSAFWAGLIEWLNVNFFDTLEAIKTWVLVNLLVPVRRVLLAIPWWWGAVVVTLAWRASAARGARRIAGGFALFIAFTGYWEQAMVTVYLVGVSVLIAAADRPARSASPPASAARVWGVVQPVIDTLQTLPSFVYLIPVVMLFRVGEFTAMIAIVLYALRARRSATPRSASARSTPRWSRPTRAMGTTPLQRLVKLRLPLALPEILLGINQTILLAISMLVITALVGTRDLGQEVYIALTRADVGAGLVAGACIAMLAMIADRLMTAPRRATRRAPGARRDDPARGSARAGGGAADLDRPGRARAAGRRHHQPQLRRRATPAGATSCGSAATSPSTAIAAPLRARRQPRRPRRRPLAGGAALASRARWSSTSSRAAPSRPRTCATRRTSTGSPTLVRRCHREIPRHSAARRRSSGSSRWSATTPTPCARRQPAPRRPAAARWPRPSGWRRRSGRSRSSSATTTCCPPTSSTTATASGWSTGNTPASTRPLFDLGGLASNAGMTAGGARGAARGLLRRAARRRPAAAGPRR